MHWICKFKSIAWDFKKIGYNVKTEETHGYIVEEPKSDYYFV